MHRRRYLALAASLASGCVSNGPAGRPDGSGETATDEPTGSPTGTSAVEGVVVSDAGVFQSVAYDSMGGSGGVLTGPDRQFVVASVRADRDLRASSFAFETDAASWSPGLPETRGAVNYAVEGRDGGPVGHAAGGDGPSFLAFTVPSPLSASNPRIRHAGTGNAWPLSDAAAERLAAPAPRFELDALSVPETVSRGEQLSVSLRASNVSEVDGRFLAAVYLPTKLIADDDESHVVAESVAAGDDVEASLSLDTEYVTGEPETVTLSLEGHVAAERAVRIRDASSPF